MPEQSNDYRVVVFGAGGVGKTSLVLRFIQGTFRDSYIPTIEDTYRKVVIHLEEPILEFFFKKSAFVSTGDLVKQIDMHTSHHRHNWFTSVPSHAEAVDLQRTCIHSGFFDLLQTKS